MLFAQIPYPDGTKGTLHTISYATSHRMSRPRRTMCRPGPTTLHAMINVLCRISDIRYQLNVRYRTSDIRHRRSRHRTYPTYDIGIRYRTYGTYDIVRLRCRTSKHTMSYVNIGIIRYRTFDVRCRTSARIQMVCLLSSPQARHSPLLRRALPRAERCQPVRRCVVGRHQRRRRRRSRSRSGRDGTAAVGGRCAGPGASRFARSTFRCIACTAGLVQ